MKLKLIPLFILLLIPLLSLSQTVSPQLTDSSKHKICLDRPVYEVIYSAAIERDLLCNDMNVVNLKLTEYQNRAGKKNTVIEMLLGIIIVESAVLYFK